MNTLAMLAALGTAACWAASPFISFSVIRQYGALAFVRLRIFFAAVMLILLLPLHIPLGEWNDLMTLREMWFYAMTGVIGIAIGDALLFDSIKRIGPRRNALLFAMQAPFAFLFAAALIGEIPSLSGLAGCAATVGGVILAIRYGGARGSFRAETHRYETTQGPLVAAVAIGLGAAACQAIALVMVRGMAHTDFDPVAVATLRVAAAAIVFAPAPLLLPGLFARDGDGDSNSDSDKTQNQNRKTYNRRELAWRAALVGFLAVVVGVSLLNFALKQNVHAGIIASLVATSPVMVLFIQWALTKTRPRAAAFAGAVITVAGVAVLSFATV